MAAEPSIVQAVFPFKGINNDELCFEKGDFIIITQKDEGWWEGTFNGQTGWFPSNYVKESKDAPKPIVLQQNQYKSVVVKDLIDSEKAHVTELEGLVTNFLQPLEKSSILSADEYKQLTGNIATVLETHQQLLNLIEIEESKPATEQKVGKLFLNWAPKIKNIHQTYCSLHPRAVCILEKYKDELTKYMESKGAASPGVLVLTTLLSKPFRRLEKYSGMLRELERHVEESHQDRGDTQRSVAIYKDIAATCAETRRQKELELQVLTGPIRNWEGPSVTTLGEIIYMGSVAEGLQYHDRFFILFPSCLLILSVGLRLSAFIFEGMLPLSGLNVVRLEDNDEYKNAFEIYTNMTEKKLTICRSKDEANHWVELLKKTMPRSSNMSDLNQKVAPSQAQFVPQPLPHLSQRGYSTRKSVLDFKIPINYSQVLPPENYPSTSPFARITKYYRKLIREKVITSKLLRNLLYPEYLNKRNLNLVKIRHHKTELVIMTRGINCRDSIIECDSDSDDESASEDDEESNVRLQNALDKGTTSTCSNGSSSSNPFGYIRYYNPQTGSHSDSQTRYESFIDYGIPITQPEMVKEDKKMSITLTSSAKIQLQTQWSENSEGGSSFTHKPSLTCEDLSNLKGSLELSTMPKCYIPVTRQSCPTKFVANKFNPNSMTSIYIPSYSNSDNNITCRTMLSNKTDTILSDVSSTETHSSSVEFTVNTIPLPDKMLAELLYNFEPDDEVDEHVEDSLTIESCTDDSPSKVIKPPTMFRNGVQTDPVLSQDTLSLHLNNIGFRNHSFNSDKPKRRSSIQVRPEDITHHSTETPKRCVSSQYLLLSNPNFDSQSTCCPCCMEDLMMHSPRSSDSGMAGSCTLNSPDLANANDLPSCSNQRRCSLAMTNSFRKYQDASKPDGDTRSVISLSEIEARDFESQCPCISPFSTPRTSCQMSVSENIITGSHTSLRKSVTTSIDLCSVGSQPKIHSKTADNSEGVVNGESLSKSKSVGCLLDSPTCSAVDFGGVEENEQPLIYKSGLYAHWWLKAKIPAKVVRGIYEDTRSPATDVSTGGGVKHNQSPSRKK